MGLVKALAVLLGGRAVLYLLESVGLQAGAAVSLGVYLLLALALLYATEKKRTRQPKQEAKVEYRLDDRGNLTGLIFQPADHPEYTLAREYHGGRLYTSPSGRSIRTSFGQTSYHSEAKSPVHLLLLCLLVALVGMELELLLQQVRPFELRWTLQRLKNPVRNAVSTLKALAPEKDGTLRRMLRIMWQNIKLPGRIPKPTLLSLEWEDYWAVIKGNLEQIKDLLAQWIG